jgi:iron complex outermembrane receptor protein
VCRYVTAAVTAAYAIALGLGSVARADQSLPIVVVQATAIPGDAIDIDKIPGNVQILGAADLSRDGSASLTGALNAQFGSVSVNDNLDDPFQPDILFRGFEASPVLGTPQGLAVYQNGVRINEAFGDTVNWDLFPDVAIDRVDLVSSSAVYGLNALGGGVSINMKNGFTHRGGDLDVSAGSFGQHSAVLQYGAASEHLGLYVAGKVLDQSGWRLFSDDTLRQFYASIGARAAGATLDLSYTHADNRLYGQGSEPVQELAVNRGLVFTGPQANLNRLDFLSLNGTLEVAPGWSLQSVLYYRQYRQSVANGNTTAYTSCTTEENDADLCQADGSTPLTNAAGAILPDISAGGSLAIGENDFESIRSYGRGGALQATSVQKLMGHDNHFAAGATLDYALVEFHSGAELGVIDAQLTVLPSGLLVQTTENAAAGQDFGAVPVSLRAVNQYLGYYVTDTFDATSAVSVTASGRYNVATIDLHDQLGTNLTGNNRYSHFNPALGITYKLGAEVTAYAGVSRNTRTPTASEIECSDPLQPCLLPSNLAGDPPNLRQVVAHTTELGLRGRFLRANGDGGTAAAGGGGSEVSWNIGVFRTQLHDDIYGIATSVSQGFFQNIGGTRREGLEAGWKYRTARWSAFANYSYVDATFESALTLPSPSNPFQDENGDIHVRAGDRLPGIPRHRLKIGADFELLPQWTVGAGINIASSQYYFGDESNQNARLPGYQVVGLHSTYRVGAKIEIFASISNLFDRRYATYGLLSDPTGVGTPGVPPDGITNGPGVDNRFQSPAAPFAAFGGVRIAF